MTDSGIVLLLAAATLFGYNAGRLLAYSSEGSRRFFLTILGMVLFALWLMLERIP